MSAMKICQNDDTLFTILQSIEDECLRSFFGLSKYPDILPLPRCVTLEVIFVQSFTLEL